VRRIRLLSELLVLLTIGLGGCFSQQTLSSPPTGSAPVSPTPKPDIQYKVYSLPRATVYSLQIPTQRFFLMPALSDEVDSLETFVRKHGAIAAINGGFFDPVNQKSTSYITIKEKLVADPRLNGRLINNPDLAPYLSKILNRSEFRRYRCGQAFQYAIVRHSDSIPPNCQLMDALGGGPQLLPENTSQQEGFVDYANGATVRDSLGSEQPNARSAIGIAHDGSILLVMAAQKPEAPKNSGMSLSELAAFLKTLGAQQAMNLDGGTSSTLSFQGKTSYGKLDETGKIVTRPIKSVLLVQEKL
jgi:hypothetical protein